MQYLLISPVAPNPQNKSKDGENDLWKIYTPNTKGILQGEQ